MNQGTCSVIRTIVNKIIVPQRPKQRGRKGYGNLLIARLLVYVIVTRIFSNKGMKTHLENNTNYAKILGFKTIPHRTTISRWKKKHELLFQVINNLGNLVQLLIAATLQIADSTPIPDDKDPDAKKGKTSKGWFTGFKAHVLINQLGIPIRAVLTTGNVYDSTQLPNLIEGLKSLFLIGDKGHDSKYNRKFARKQGMVPIIPRNRRRSKRKPRKPRYYILYKHFKYLVEQSNSLLKKEMLKGYWVKVRGFERKATFVYSGIIAIQLIAINALINGDEELLRISKYR